MTVQRARRSKHASVLRSGTETAIVDAARSLLNLQPFADVSVEDIMATAGLSRTVFYRHFNSREQLLARLLTSAAADLREASGSWLDNADADLAVALLRTVRAYETHAALIRAASDASITDAKIAATYRQVIEEFIAATERRIRTLQERGAAIGIDPRRTAEALVWCNERYQYIEVGHTPTEVIAETLHVLWSRVLGST